MLTHVQASRLAEGHDADDFDVVASQSQRALPERLRMSRVRKALDRAAIGPRAFN